MLLFLFRILNNNKLNLQTLKDNLLIYIYIYNCIIKYIEISLNVINKINIYIYELMKIVYLFQKVQFS